MRRDIEARIEFLNSADGGRHTPVFSGYRGQFHYLGESGAWEAPHEYPDREGVRPGETVQAYLAFLRPDKHVGRITPGLEFELHEASRLIAKGVVTEVMELKDNAIQAKSEKT